MILSGGGKAGGRKRRGTRQRRRERQQTLRDVKFEQLVKVSERVGLDSCCFCGFQRYEVTTVEEESTAEVLGVPVRRFKAGPGRLDDEGKLPLRQECLRCRNWNQWKNEGPRFEHPAITKYQNWIDACEDDPRPEVQKLVPKGVWRRRYHKPKRTPEEMPTCPECDRTFDFDITVGRNRAGSLVITGPDSKRVVHTHLSAEQKAAMQAGRRGDK